MNALMLDPIIKNIKMFSKQCISYLEAIPDDQIRNDGILKTGNSAGILVFHIIGNVGQYIFAGVLGEDDIRRRNDEFKKKEKVKKSEIINIFENMIKKVITRIKLLPEEERKQKIKVQCFEMTKYGALISSTSHMYLHIGQIVEIGAKFSGNKKYFDSLYDLNSRN